MYHTESQNNQNKVLRNISPNQKKSSGKNIKKTIYDPKDIRFDKEAKKAGLAAPEDTQRAHNASVEKRIGVAKSRSKDAKARLKSFLKGLLAVLGIGATGVAAVEFTKKNDSNGTKVLKKAPKKRSVQR